MPVPAKFDKSQIVPLDDGVPQKFDTSQIQPLDSAPPVTQPEKPGIISRAWQAANTPIADLSQRGRNESQKLEDVQSGPTSLADLKWRNEHPVQNVARQYLAGVEERASNLATPLVAATVGLGALPAEASAALNSIPGIAKVGTFLKAAVPVAFGAQGAQQVGQAATDDTLDPDTRLRMALGGAAAVTGAGASAAETFKGPMTKTLENVRKGAQSMVGAGEQAIKSNVAGESESAEGAYQASKKASQKNTEDTLESQAKTKQERIEALKKQREDKREHTAKLEEAKSENTQAVRAQGDIKPTQQKLKTARRELQAQIETARENSLKTGNAEYNAVNSELDPIEADPETSQSIYSAAAEGIPGDKLPPLLKDFGDRIQRGPLTYDDYQSFYSKSGNAISRGGLEGETYHAYDQMHEGIGKEMQSIAARSDEANGLLPTTRTLPDGTTQRVPNPQGAEAKLSSSRNYWRRMKQAFGKQYNPTDAGNATLEKATGIEGEEEQANRVRLLGSFDKTIPQTVEHIGNLRKGIESLPDEKPIRDVVKPLPAAPENTKLPEYGEPKGSVPFEKPAVNTREIREKLLDRWTSTESQLSKFQVRRLVSGGIGAVVGGLFEGTAGAGIGGLVGSELGPAAIAKVVKLPSVREWLTRPPAGELETLQKLPYADRIKLTDGLKKVVTKAQSEGVKVNPSVLTVLGVSGGLPRTQQLQQLRDELRKPPEF